MLKLIKAVKDANTAFETERALEEKYSLLGSARNYNEILGDYPISAKMLINNLRSVERDGTVHQHFMDGGTEEEQEGNLSLYNLEATVNKFVSYMRTQSGKKVAGLFNESMNIEGFMESLVRLLGFVILEEKLKRGLLVSEKAIRTMAERVMFKEIKNEIFHATMKANKLYNETLDAEKSFEIMSECIRSGMKEFSKSINQAYMIEDSGIADIKKIELATVGL